LGGVQRELEHWVQRRAGLVRSRLIADAGKRRAFGLDAQ
jgi:hypothetical protein